MATTDFTNGITLTDDDWFDDVDFLVYDLFGDSTTTASAAARLAPSFNNLTVAGTLSVSAQATMAGLAVGGVLSATSVAGAVIATQAQMESASSTTTVVTPGRLIFNHGVAKAWVVFDGSVASVTASQSYNLTSIADNGSGDYTMTFTTSFSAAYYPVICFPASAVGGRLFTSTTTTARIQTLDSSGNLTDATDKSSLVAFGDR